ncbi:hypothetical protein [Endozoicomonas elysicola]|uniref:Uncharacterized protein n=1 Tax=Endozoicomonas elysicola TaxID=305900 RepID=A0A081KAX2_9GAMM|nr:hypothetical protein [Endozoicomonas elysicola]KEI71298.1 hypothetical protein GV64_11620 [Endozoicomonas elysicola]
MSILKRKNHAGKARCTAVVRKTITAQRFSDRKNFGSLQAVRAWGRIRVVELEEVDSATQLANQQSRPP